MAVAHLQGFSKKTAIWTDTSAPGDSGWQDGRVIAAPFTVEVWGLAGGGKAQLYGTNRPSPDAGFLGTQIGTDISQDGVVSVTTNYRHYRVILSVASTTPASAAFFGHRPPA